MMVGRPVQLEVQKSRRSGEAVLEVEHFSVPSKLHKKDAVHDVTFTARSGRSCVSRALMATARPSWYTA